MLHRPADNHHPRAQQRKRNSTPPKTGNSRKSPSPKRSESTARSDIANSPANSKEIPPGNVKSSFPAPPKAPPLKASKPIAAPTPPPETASGLQRQLPATFPERQASPNFQRWRPACRRGRLASRPAETTPPTATPLTISRTNPAPASPPTSSPTHLSNRLLSLLAEKNSPEQPNPRRRIQRQKRAQRRPSQNWKTRHRNQQQPRKRSQVIRHPAPRNQSETPSARAPWQRRFQQQQPQAPPTRNQQCSTSAAKLPVAKPPPEPRAHNETACKNATISTHAACPNPPQNASRCLVSACFACALSLTPSFLVDRLCRPRC